MASSVWPHRPISSPPPGSASERISSSPEVLSSPLHMFPRIRSPDSPVSKRAEEYRLSWDPPADPKVSYQLPSFRSLFASDDEPPSTSDYAGSEYSETREDESTIDSDQEEERETDSYSDCRVTFFSISAERGRWAEVMPRHFRTSARTTSPVPVPATVFVSRNISEPAPSTKPSPAIIQSQLPFTSPPPALSPDLSSTLGHSSPRTFSEPLSPLSLPPSSLAGDYDMEFESFPDLEETPYVGLLDVSVKSEIPAQDSSTGAALSEPIASPSPSERAISAANGASLSPVLQLAVDVGPEVEARSPETLPLHEADTNRVKRRGDHGREEAPRKKARFVPALAAPKLSDAKRTNDKSLLKGLPLEKKAKGEPKPRSVKQRRNRPRSPSRETFTDLDPELTGMLIESMATSRASSLPMSSLFKITMQSYPSFKSRGTEEQCLEMMERALEAGTLEAGGSGLFDKVERDPSDESESRHDSLWYYQPERDPDQDRAQLIKSMMPRPAKRAETKKHKQYYYRPLEKISKWDSEDAL